ncbi:MAG TPA: dihydrodipicolinate reductase [Myxococcota bacterium]|nr:dihydrodipicolinate reductase [Myxococcota bacterium]
MPIRVAQWSTGIVGSAAVRAIAEHPELELVACFAWGRDKVGRDVGVLCGIGRLGVAASDSLDALIAARPDCVLYMPLLWDVDAMLRLLEAGIDVISTANFITGASYGRAEQARLDAAARRGGASLYGTGINPGFANALGLMATAICRRVERVSVLESVDSTAYASAETWRALGFGELPGKPGLVEAARQRSLVFLDAVEMMAAALRLKLDDVRYDVAFGVATRDLELGYMQIARGRICGLKAVWSGIAHGRPAIELGLMWRLGDAMEPDWKPVEGYVIEVDGEPGVRCRFHAEYGAGADFGLVTAMPAVHAIPAVVAARPGLVTAADLPLVVAAHCVRAS